MSTPTLRVRLLGQLELLRGETPLPPLESARAESLLAYLVLHREAPQPRQRLAFLLWPDSTESQARTNLRHVLHILRRALPDADRFLDVTPRTLQWRADAPAWLDVAAFEEALTRAQGQAVGLAMLRAATDLYRGDLLEACYDEWIATERERLRQRFLDALERLAALLEAAGEYGEAIVCAERLLRHDPLHEATYRLLMHLHDARRDRARALRVYHVCSATLERELGVEPSTATRALYDSLLRPERQAAKQPPGRVAGPALVGRASEVEQLRAAWRAAEHNTAGLAFVTGEPGIGKTRLVDELRTWCAHRGAVTAFARSYPAEGALAYAPVVEWLRSEAFKPRLTRLDRARLTDLARLLPELSSEVAGLAYPEALPESDQRPRLFDAMARAIYAAGGPLLLVADDIHWCDRETLRFLHYLLRADPDVPLLVVATARREEVEPDHPLRELSAGLQALDRVTEIHLGRLTREETVVLGERLAGRALEQPAAMRLYHETEGNPLFVVEALRAASSSPEPAHAWLTPKVQAVLEARLAQLSAPASELAGVAATIGREWTPEVLALAAEVDQEALVRGLDELWRRGIAREHGVNAYDFSHDKLREVAYRALSPARRRSYHLRVAQALEQLYAGDRTAVAGQIAAHYDHAGVIAQAVRWYGLAAEAAQQLHASVDAVRLLSRALDLLRTLPETRDRQTRELELLVALPGPLVAVEGYRSSRLVAVHRRGLEVAQVLGIEPEAPLLRSLALASLAHADFEQAREYGRQLQALGERAGDDVLFVESQYVLGVGAFWQGDFVTACVHLEAAVTSYRPEHRRAHLLQYGQDPQAVCLIRLGYARCFLGQLDGAVHARDAALVRAAEIGHHYTHLLVALFASMLALELRDADGLRTYVAAAVDALGEHDATHIRLSVEALSVLIDVLEGGGRAAVARIEGILDDPSVAEQPAPGFHAAIVRVLLAACVSVGDARSGLTAATRVMEMGSDAQLWEAEARRLRADYLIALGASSQEIEPELQRALEVARRQRSSLLELRAATSLLRYLLERGDHGGAQQARGLLAGLVDSLAEARDTPDLRDAAVLLEQVDY